MHFVTLRCGILTLKTPDSFFRSFCFLRQNGEFSATEQNQIYKSSLFLEGEIQFGKKFFPFGDSYSNENYRLLGNPLIPIQDLNTNFHLEPKDRKPEI